MGVCLLGNQCRLKSSSSILRNSQVVLQGTEQVARSQSEKPLTSSEGSVTSLIGKVSWPPAIYGVLFSNRVGAMANASFGADHPDCRRRHSGGNDWRSVGWTKVDSAFAAVAALKNINGVAAGVAVRLVYVIR